MIEEQVDIKTPEYVSLKFSLAGLGSRGAAFAIDQLVIMLLYFIIFLVVFFLLESTFDIVEIGDSFGMLIAFVIISVFVINNGYFFFLEFFWGGRTVGKRIIGLRTIQDNGHRITVLSSFIRNLLRIIDDLPASYLVGIILIFSHPQHKRLGDLAAGTIVVHESHTKQKKSKKNAVVKLMADRGWSKETLAFTDWQLQAINQKDWELVKTFCHRYSFLPLHEKNQLTQQVAEIILPKIGLPVNEHNPSEVVKILFVLYVNSRDEWDFEL